MKKIALLLTVVLTSMQVNYYAQEETKCAPTLLMNLNDCFVSSNLYASLVYSSDGYSASVFFEGNPNVGLVTACMTQYDHDRISCPDAPLLVTDTYANYRGTKRS